MVKIRYSMPSLLLQPMHRRIRFPCVDLLAASYADFKMSVKRPTARTKSPITSTAAVPARRFNGDSSAASWWRWLADMQEGVFISCRRLQLNDTSSIEDVFQETILRCLKKDVPAEKSSAIRFACSIAKGICIDKYRSEARSRRVNRVGFVHRSEDTDWELFIERRIFIVELLEKLSPSDRTIVKALFVQQGSLKEVSQLLGVSERTCRKRTLLLFERLRCSAVERGSPYGSTLKNPHREKEIASPKALNDNIDLHEIAKLFTGMNIFHVVEAQ